MDNGTYVGCPFSGQMKNYTTKYLQESLTIDTKCVYSPGKTNIEPANQVPNVLGGV